MTELRDRLRTIVVDEKSSPAKITEAAHLLGDTAAWEEEGERLGREVEAMGRRLRGETPGPYEHKSLADWAYAVLREIGGPMNYRALADAIRTRGYTPTAKQQRTEKQLSDSVWIAMHSDARFVKVARGVWDLAEHNRERGKT